MPTPARELMDLERRFWQSLVDDDVDTALSLLHEPAAMVSPHGTLQFDHAAYRRMAELGSVVIKSFQFSDMDVMFPTDDTAVLTYRVRQALSPRGEAGEVVQDMADASVWTRKDGRWRCAMHTETPVEPGGRGA